MTIRFSIIIPVLHEAAIIGRLLEHLREIEHADRCEFIVVDGSADGDTIKVLAPERAVCLTAKSGRAGQMNAGAAAAKGEILIFLHADTRLPDDALTMIDGAMSDDYVGGAFRLAIRSNKPIFRFIAAGANFRSRLTGIPYGDQAIFLENDFFHRLGGYPEIPLMEDIALMERIKKSGRKICILPRAVTTSARRWEREGVIYGILRNRILSAALYCGVSPERLARCYKIHREDERFHKR